ncbi:alpha-ketoglutarate permease, partial [Acinetobacter baumannii]|nr:alpha-ketoglutarate permease [Acinetobacter baumannii]
NTLFGGTAEFFALSFKEAGHESWFFIYVSIMIFISLLIYIFMKDTKHHSKIKEH